MDRPYGRHYDDNRMDLDDLDDEMDRLEIENPEEFARRMNEINREREEANRINEEIEIEKQGELENIPKLTETNEEELYKFLNLLKRGNPDKKKFYEDLDKVFKNNPDIVNYFSKSRGEVEYPLKIAFELGDVELVEYLVNRGAMLKFRCDNLDYFGRIIKDLVVDVIEEFNSYKSVMDRSYKYDKSKQEYLKKLEQIKEYFDMKREEQSKIQEYIDQGIIRRGRPLPNEEDEEEEEDYDEQQEGGSVSTIKSNNRNSSIKPCRKNSSRKSMRKNKSSKRNKSGRKNKNSKRKTKTKK